MPLDLDQVPADNNIGVLLGKHSGIVAIDFDGTTAIDWFYDRFDISADRMNTVSWTSGREGRCQMAFTVPVDLHEFIKTRKQVTKEPSFPGARDGEGFEFRWTGCQSVLPPSVHPDTNKPYEWIVNPTNQVLECPVEILEWAMEEKPVVEREVYVPTPDELTDEKFNDIESMLQKIKHYHPTLDYDTWFKIVCITANELGDGVAEYVLQSLWPEQRAGEYRKKITSRNRSRSGSAGSLVAMIRKHEPRYKMKTAEIVTNRHLSNLKKLLKEYK
jgi:hypothetical protein